MMNDPIEQTQPEGCETEEQENDLIQQLKGLTVTDASYSDNDGYMIELDHRFQIRSCSSHTSIFRRTTQ